MKRNRGKLKRNKVKLKRNRGTLKRNREKLFNCRMVRKRRIVCVKRKIL